MRNPTYTVTSPSGDTVEITVNDDGTGAVSFVIDGEALGGAKTRLITTHDFTWQHAPILPECSVAAFGEPAVTRADHVQGVWNPRVSPVTTATVEGRRVADIIKDRMNRDRELKAAIYHEIETDSEFGDALRDVLGRPTGSESGGLR